MPAPLIPLIIGGAALGGLGYLSKERQAERQQKALEQEQAFRQAIAPTAGFTGRYQGPVDYSQVQYPGLLPELGAGALGGASIGQQMAGNSAWVDMMNRQGAAPAMAPAMAPSAGYSLGADTTFPQPSFAGVASPAARISAPAPVVPQPRPNKKPSKKVAMGDSKPYWLAAAEDLGWSGPYG